MRSFWLLLLLIPLMGCPPKTRCEVDTDCDPDGSAFLRCLLDEGGFCGCSDDRGCSDGEVCNAAGRCQVVGGCISNADCSTGAPEACANQFCDTTTATCLSVCECGESDTCCTQDSQCPFKQICNGFENKCVPGCRNDGDCILGEGCVGAGLAGQLGTCEVGQCTANNQCGFGEICNLAEGACTVDVRGPYCAGCSGGVASEDCAEPANYCLLDPGGGNDFCGVDCTLDQACPFGYECSEVIILPPAAPACVAPETCNESVCSRTGGACTIDEDCPEGPPHSNCPRGDLGTCLLDQTLDCNIDGDCCEGGDCPGSCIKQECRGGEGAVIGSCSCTRDLDCPTDSCDGADLTDPDNPIPGNCELSGHACLADPDCAVIACVDGGCRLGANCAPANDRTCSDLLQ